jgi:dTDP-4-dehydrorhamnose 3,5-epimerase-like enzyme
MKGVEIRPLDVVKQDERGLMFQFENRETPRLLLVKRKQGTVSAACYHTGKDPGRFPKIFLLMNGEAEVVLKNIRTREELRQVFKEPMMFKVDPYIYHEVRALTDIVVMDMNAADWYKGDTIKGFPE